MKKIVILVLMTLPVFIACQKEEKLEEKLEGHAGNTDDDYGLNEKELAQIAEIKKEIILEIRKGDSITISSLRNEIDSLKIEIHKLKTPK